MDKIIEIKDLKFSYKNYEDQSEIEVIKGINIDVNEGEFVAILGHNGSGKSTLAKHLNGIFYPSEGKVYVYGIDTSDESKAFEIRQKVGMVFQNPDNQIVATIVEEDVAFAPENLGVSREEIRERVDSALKCVDMYEFRNHAPHMLSGGQKQRVAIAGIIAMRPKCIVLDEPTAMLDPKGRREVMQTIEKLNKEENITIVLITHYMDEAVRADRVVVMEEGLIVMNDAPKKVFSNVDKLKEIGLDVPQATELTDMLIKSGISLPTDILTGDEFIKEISKVLGENKCQ